MSAPFRRIAIERVLADWFRRDGWEISGGRASKALGIEGDDFGFFEEECSVDINDLSNELDAEFDRIGGAK